MLLIMYRQNTGRVTWNYRIQCFLLFIKKLLNMEKFWQPCYLSNIYMGMIAKSEKNCNMRTNLVNWINHNINLYTNSFETARMDKSTKINFYVQIKLSYIIYGDLVNFGYCSEFLSNIVKTSHFSSILYE